MSLWENENNQNENGEKKNDAVEADFTVKDTGNDSTKETNEEKPTYVFENLYKDEFERERNRKKKKRDGMRMSGGGVAAIVALCLVVSIISGIVTGMFIGRQNSPSDIATSTTSTSASVMTPGQTTQTDGTTATTTAIPLIKQAESSNNMLSPEEIAAKCTDSVVIVEVVTVTTYTMFGKTYEQASRGAGSGVIYSADGYVITNYHVASEACRSITVTTNDGKTYNAEFITGDKDADVALIKLENASGLTPAKIGTSSNLAVGNYVAAIGNPLGYGLTFTDGKVSALSRKVSIDGSSMTLIQTNAAVNEGNSGGGLFNAAGELVGIVNAKISGDTVEGFGFAIPIDTVVKELNDLIEVGYIRDRARLGVTINSLYLIDEKKNYSIVYYIQSVLSGSCAEKAGLQTGDILYMLDGEFAPASSFAFALSKYKVGDTVELTILRPKSGITSSTVYESDCTKITVSVTFEEFNPNVQN